MFIINNPDRKAVRPFSHHRRFGRQVSVTGIYHTIPCHTTDANTGKVTGTKHNAKTFTKFEFWLQLFADDAAMIFESREDMQIGLRHIVAHLSKFADCGGLLCCVTRL